LGRISTTRTSVSFPKETVPTSLKSRKLYTFELNSNNFFKFLFGTTRCAEESSIHTIKFNSVHIEYAKTCNLQLATCNLQLAARNRFLYSYTRHNQLLYSTRVYQLFSRAGAYNRTMRVVSMYWIFSLTALLGMEWSFGLNS
jgi:hypothetical protein